MNYVYVAYDGFGNLIATADTYDALIFECEWRGYWIEELIIGRTKG